jgi:hypothetical protein
VQQVADGGVLESRWQYESQQQALGEDAGGGEFGALAPGSGTSREARGHGRRADASRPGAQVLRVGGAIRYSAAMTAKMVSVGECFGMGDAMLIRSALSAHDIEAVIPGLSSGTAAYTSGFTSKILVDAEHAEEATALIAELRSGASQAIDADDDEGGDGADARQDRAAMDDAAPMMQRRRWAVVTVLAALSVPLGAGHLVNRAFGRALLLGGAQVLAVSYMSAGHRVAAAMVAAVVALDILGALALVRKRFASSVRAPLPTASVRRVS